jgi:diguanylate cyclase (GGDEF)-like protein/PAS domain S-box-containing protein
MYAAYRHAEEIHVTDEVFWRKDGTAVPVEYRSHPIVSDGVVTGAIATFVDIADRRRAIEALKESETKFRTLFESAGDAIFLMDQEIFIHCNPKTLAMFGCSREQIIGQPPYRFSPELQPDGRRSVDKAKEKIEAAFSGRPQFFEWTHCRYDGTPFDAEVSLNTFVTGGKPFLQAIVRDISERKLAEHQLRIAATVFEAQEGMMVTDADHVILRVNKAFTNITGYSADEAVGKTPFFLKSDRQNQQFYDAMWENIDRTGAWEGEIWNRRKNGETYAQYLTITAVKDQNGIVTQYVGTFADITLKKKAAEEIEHLAFYDPLTHLPNRRLFQERLRQALTSSLRTGKTGVLFFIDLDNFKEINDTLGHDMGDLLLQQVSDRLNTCVRGDDTVARLGGDEFVVMLEDLSEEQAEAIKQAETIANKILALINQPFNLAHHDYSCTPSIGATLFKGYQRSMEELLKQADIAMYQAKNAGRNAFCFFEP